jgi:hypothetical protein
LTIFHCRFCAKNSCAEAAYAAPTSRTEFSVKNYYSFQANFFYKLSAKTNSYPSGTNVAQFFGIESTSAPEINSEVSQQSIFSLGRNS